MRVNHIEPHPSTTKTFDVCGNYIRKCVLTIGSYATQAAKATILNFLSLHPSVSDVVLRPHEQATTEQSGTSCSFASAKRAPQPRHLHGPVLVRFACGSLNVSVDMKRLSLMSMFFF